MTDDEIRQAAKAVGIKSWHVKSIKALKAELEAPAGETATPDEVSEVAADIIAEIAPKQETTAAPVLLIKQYADGTHYREWTNGKEIEERLSRGWIKASV
jgi:hypothetical protein